MQAGQAYRNQTSSSKGSYQKTTFRFNVAFQVPLDKTQRKETSVPALSFSGPPLPLTPKQPGPSSGPPLLPSFLLSQEGEGHPPPSLILIVCPLQRPGLCPFFTMGGPIPHPTLAQKTTWTPSRGRFPAWGQVQPGSRTASHLPWGLGARNSQRPFVPTKESLSLFHSPLPSGQKRWQITNQQAMQTQCQRPGLGLRDPASPSTQPTETKQRKPATCPSHPCAEKIVLPPCIRPRAHGQVGEG